MAEKQNRFVHSDLNEVEIRGPDGRPLSDEEWKRRALLRQIKSAAASPKINREFDVPYLAGSSNDGRTVYIDKRVPHELVVKGKSFDPAPALAAHELAEHSAMMKGKSYVAAHREDGLPAERKVVEASGVDWLAYQEQMHKLAENVTEPEKAKNPPPDLYLKPYPHREAEFLAREAKSNDK